MVETWRINLWGIIPGCTRRMDVVLALDASGSTEAVFELALEASRYLVQGFNFAQDRTRVGVATFSDDATIRFHLNAVSRYTQVRYHQD